MFNILLVDDEIELTESLAQVLINEGYEVELALDGKRGLELALKNDYDLLILDWMLPYKSGVEICQSLRKESMVTPVLFLTAKDTIDDRVLGLDIGADDYIVKPFELRELLARIRALLRRKVNDTVKLNNINPSRLKIADLELDMENQVAYRQGRVIKLSEKEIKLLTLFMNNSDQLLTHRQIDQHLWQEEDHPNSNVLAAFIRLLRRKIEKKGETPLIHTVYGKGYRFGKL